MSINLITKEAIAAAFEKLLLERPFAKIPVKDITEVCGISRNTFYYHFKDKYELMDWIVRGDLSQSVTSYDDPQLLAETFIDVCRMMYERKRFYYACLQYEGQNSLYEFFTNFYYELWKVNIASAYDSEGTRLGDYEVSVYAKMNAHALVGVIRDWVHSGMQNNYMSYFSQVNKIIKVQSELYKIMTENRSQGKALPKKVFRPVAAVG